MLLGGVRAAPVDGHQEAPAAPGELEGVGLGVLRKSGAGRGQHGLQWRERVADGGVHAVDHPVLAPRLEQHEPARRPLSVQDELDLAIRPLLHVVRAGVPDGHGAAAVLALRDLAVEGEVLHRMVLGVHRQVVGAGVGGQALGDGPGDQHAVTLQAQVPVQGSGVVLLDDEGVPARGGRGGFGDGLGGAGWVAFAPVSLQFVGHRSGTTRCHCRRSGFQHGSSTGYARVRHRSGTRASRSPSVHTDRGGRFLRCVTQG